MLESLKSVLFTCTLFCVSLSHAATIVLKPEPLPDPLVFASVNGTVGLGSEVITAGQVSVLSAAFSESVALDSSGNFDLSVAAGSNFNLNFTLFLEGVPNVNLASAPYAALVEGEVKTLDLTRPSGRLQAKVTVNGGTAQSASVSTSATIITNSIFDTYTSTANANVQAGQATDVLLASPSGVVTTAKGRVQVLNDNGCQHSVNLTEQSITLSDLSVAGASPGFVEWVLDVTAQTCEPDPVPLTALISGDFLLNGLDSSIVMNSHQLSFLGPRTTSLILTGFGPYVTEPVLEGFYRTTLNGNFAAPYGRLSYANGNVTVAGDTVYNAIRSVGTSHGVLNFTGDWGYGNLVSARLDADGSDADLQGMSAEDAIDLLTGQYDLVLGAGTWDSSSYVLGFSSVLNGRSAKQALDIKLLGDLSYSITEGQSLVLADVSLPTAATELLLSVEQAAGQTNLVTINKLTIKGSAELTGGDAANPVIIANSTINAESVGVIDGLGTDNSLSDFVETIYGLPGTYTLTASGLGSDGRVYSATFDVVLGGVDPGPVDPGPVDPGPVDPGPVDPGPVDPGPVDPGPVDPGPVDPGPVDPGPVDPGPVDPGPVDPGPVDPGPVDPGPVDPGPVDPGPVDPGPVDPGPVDPGPVDPGPVDPGPVDPGPVDPGNGLACYSINKVKLHRHHKMDKDKLYIKYASFRLNNESMVDLAEDDVFISVDGIVYEFPAGSFKQRGQKQRYAYKSPPHELPKVKASIDFEKSKWSLIVNHADTTYIDNSDGVDIGLTIGNYQGSENVMLKSKNKHGDKLMFKRKPKVSCDIDREDDDDDEHHYGDKKDHDRGHDDEDDDKDKEDHGRDHDEDDGNDKEDHGRGHHGYDDKEDHDDDEKKLKLKRYGKGKHDRGDDD